MGQCIRQIWMNAIINMDERQRESNAMARLTFSELNINEFQLYKVVAGVSYKSFGTQHTQMEYFHRKFVRETGWLSQSQFKEISDLCWALPGPTVIQFVVTMTMLITKSPFAGMMAFLIFLIPSILVLSLLGWFASIYVTPNSELPTQLTLMFLGFNSAAAAIMTHSFIQNFKEVNNNPAKLIITISTAIIFLKLRSIGSITFCLVVGAVISLYMEIQTKKKMSMKSRDLLRETNFNWIFGRNAVLVLIVIYFLLWVWFQFWPDSKYVYTFVFYFVGCFIVGPINTIFAYFYANFLQLGLMDEEQFWLGVPFAFLLPGSIINVGIYFGSLIDGFRGTVLSALFLYLPCFLSLCGILPQWRYYRDKPGIQRLINGITCVATGLTFSMVILSLEHSMKLDVSITICTFIVSFFLNYVWGLYSFMIILMGGILANARRWGLIYYRFLPDHSYSAHP